jgi:hypothetical protein
MNKGCMGLIYNIGAGNKKCIENFGEKPSFNSHFKEGCRKMMMGFGVHFCYPKMS